MHKAMQKAMIKVGMPLDRGPLTPFDHKPADAHEQAAALRAQLQTLRDKPSDGFDRAALKAELEAFRYRMEAHSPETGSMAMYLPRL